MAFEMVPRILITSGGTKVPIDGVRDITNMSNGTFGAKIAREALIAGAHVIFFRAKHSKTPFSAKFDFYGRPDWEEMINQFADLHNFAEEHRDRYKEVGFRNFGDYNGPIHHLMLQEKPDIIILAAAVSDFLVRNVVDGKVRSEGDYRIELEEAPKVISMVKTTMPEVFLVGFKLLVNSTQNELLDAAWKSVTNNGCDLVVANDLRDIKGASHKVLLVRAGPSEEPIAELYQSPDENLAKVVVEEAIELWRKKESCSASPVA
jgi:phosphopantothenoylcysteine decarboxylase/phosphopantothenate--cysteine ligase